MQITIREERLESAVVVELLMLRIRVKNWLS